MWGNSLFAMGMPGLGMILIWGLLLVAFVFVARGIAGRNDDHTNAPSALEILKARYARGDIDEAEYRQRRTELEK